MVDDRRYRYFLNITNHPSANWPKEQREAALAIGREIVDIPFPEIDPTWESVRVVEMAVDFFKDLQDRSLLPAAAVVQGEYTFSFALVLLFLRANLPCYNATTKRMVQHDESGAIVKRFEFVQFRAFQIPRQ